MTHLALPHDNSPASLRDAPTSLAELVSPTQRNGISSKAVDLGRDVAVALHVRDNGSPFLIFLLPEQALARLEAAHINRATITNEELALLLRSEVGISISNRARASLCRAARELAQDMPQELNGQELTRGIYGIVRLLNGTATREGGHIGIIAGDVGGIVTPPRAIADMRQLLNAQIASFANEPRGQKRAARLLDRAEQCFRLYAEVHTRAWKGETASAISRSMKLPPKAVASWLTGAVPEAIQALGPGRTGRGRRPVQCALPRQPDAEWAFAFGVLAGKRGDKVKNDTMEIKLDCAQTRERFVAFVHQSLPGVHVIDGADTGGARGVRSVRLSSIVLASLYNKLTNGGRHLPWQVIASERHAIGFMQGFLARRNGVGTDGIRMRFGKHASFAVETASLLRTLGIVPLAYLDVKEKSLLIGNLASLKTVHERKLLVDPSKAHVLSEQVTQRAARSVVSAASLEAGAKKRLSALTLLEAKYHVTRQQSAGRLYRECGLSVAEARIFARRFDPSVVSLLCSLSEAPVRKKRVMRAATIADRMMEIFDSPLGEGGTGPARPSGRTGELNRIVRLQSWASSLGITGERVPELLSGIAEHFAPRFDSLAKAVYRRYRLFKRGIDLDEVRSVVYMELIRIARAYDPEGGRSFGKFVCAFLEPRILVHFRVSTGQTGKYGRIAREIRQNGPCPSSDVIAERYSISPRAAIRVVELVNRRTESLDRPMSDRDENSFAETVPAKGETPDAIAERAEIVSKILATSSPEERAIIQLRFFEDQTQEQIAAQLGTLRSTVQSTLTRFLKTARETLTAQSA